MIEKLRFFCLLHSVYVHAHVRTKTKEVMDDSWDVLLHVTRLLFSPPFSGQLYEEKGTSSGEQ